MNTQAHPEDAPVGIFDSGLGGLSILRHIRAQLPHEHLLYVADTGFAPYGDKSEHVVAERSLAVARFLVERGAKAIVVACNTATISAVKLMRASFPDLPIVGVEPGLKPAAAATRTGKVGVLATERTLAGAKFLQLRDQVTEATGTQFLLQPCRGLVDKIELGDTEGTLQLLHRYVTPLLDAGADTLVLGCTHYPLVQAAIEDVIASTGAREIALVDTGEAVARQLVRLLDAGHLVRPAQSDAPARLEAYTSASATALSAAFNGLIGIDPPVQEATFGAA
ncbi:glutamate racemase [Massilia sp. Root335]|uniref:glutamate racemase n=1 Tax=Massilia sp. Root335 TaxID=1736517 RepID=UPI0006FCF8C0|nr:glutamate racemase [Massilia sp. Root335]KQV50039.1 glutamate racemase [Massilia sp. Root335]